jgi:hypothetical protein
MDKKIVVEAKPIEMVKMKTPVIEKRTFATFACEQQQEYRCNKRH